ncbi:MAG: hypothetical protein ACO1OK_12230, partial [Devosia sp.]
GTITSAAGGGGDEAGGGGGFGASASGTSGGGGGGGGGRGQTITTTDGSIDAGDTVTGGTGGNGGSGTPNPYADGGGGGGGGIGVVFEGTGTLTVDGDITGGAGGDGGNGGYAGSGGRGGTGLRVTGVGAGIVINGTVTGGAGGERAESLYEPTKSINGAGGAGLIAEGIDLTIGADGTLSGGLSGDGTTRANAVTFSGGSNSFALEADSASVVGTVSAGGTSDTFRLSGTTDGNSFDASLIGSQFTGFEAFEKTGSGTWELDGAPSTATFWTIREGALALPGSTTGDITTTEDGTFLLSGGTLDGALDNAGTTIATGTITGAVTNRSTGNLSLSGDLEVAGLISNEGRVNAFGESVPGTIAVSGGGGFSTAGILSLSQAAGLAGDVLDLTAAGTFTGVTGGEAILDIDLSDAGTVAADRLLLGATQGTLALRFSPDPSRYGALTPGVLVVSTSDGGLTATATGLEGRGLVSYALQQQGTDWYVISQLNAAPLGGMVAGMRAAQALADIALPQAGEDASCRPDVSASVAGGGFATSASSAGGGLATRTSADGAYGGARFEVGLGCFTPPSGDATLRLALVGGYSTGTFEQADILPGGAVFAASSGFETGLVGLTLAADAGPFIARAALGASGTIFDLEAGIVGGAGQVLDAHDLAGGRISASGSLGYRILADGITITPMIGVSASRSWVDGIALLDLGGRIDVADHAAFAAFAGAEISGRVAIDGEAGLRWFMSGRIETDFNAEQAFVYSDAINAPVELTTTTPFGRGSFTAGLSYETQATSLGVRADLDVIGETIGTSVSATARFSF